MARTSSVVMTPAEKKAVLATLKADSKKADGEVAALVKAGKAIAKTRAAEDKAAAKAMAAAVKVADKAKAALAAAQA